MIRRPSSSSLYVRPQCSNVFYETTWPFIVKLHIEHPLEGGTKVCFKWSRAHDQDGRHLHIWKKKLYKASSPEPVYMILKIGIQHWGGGLKFYKSDINYYLWLTVTYLRHGNNKTPVDHSFKIRIVNVKKIV